MMNRVLLASKTEREAEKIKNVLKRTGFSDIDSVISGSRARRMLADNEYGLAVIASPLSDEFGRDLAVSISEKFYSGIIFICRDDLSCGIGEELEGLGIITLSKPIRDEALSSAAAGAFETYSRISAYRHSDEQVINKSEEIKLVNRAKLLMINSGKFTEPQAHRYIEKRAMDERRTRKEIAGEILELVLIE